MLNAETLYETSKKFEFVEVEVSGWWEWPQATITRTGEIAVKNRSHNPKMPIQNYKVLFDYTGHFFEPAVRLPQII